MTATNSKGQLSIPKAEATAHCAMRVNSENEEKASVSSAGFAAQRAVSTLVISALFFVNNGNMPVSIVHIIFDHSPL